MANPDGSIFWYNRRWYEYTGTTPDRMLGWGWQAVHDPAVLPAVTAGWKDSIASGREFEMVFPLRGADGVFRPFLTRVQPLRDERGRICRWFGTNTDIAEQKRAERHQRLLINELNHRVKNTLATVQSLAMQTFRADDPDRDARAVFQERLMALARAHDVLTRESWEGANLQTSSHRRSSRTATAAPIGSRSRGRTCACRRAWP